MTENEIFNVSVWDLNQLARMVTENPKGLQKARVAIQEAYALAASFGVQVDQPGIYSSHYPKAVIQIAMMAATEINADLASAIASILGPVFLKGYVQLGEIDKQFSTKTASILAELRTLKNSSLRHSTIHKYPNHPDVNSPHIIAILTADLRYHSRAL